MYNIYKNKKNPRTKKKLVRASLRWTHRVLAAHTHFKVVQQVRKQNGTAHKGDGHYHCPLNTEKGRFPGYPDLSLLQQAKLGTCEAATERSA